MFRTRRILAVLAVSISLIAASCGSSSTAGGGDSQSKTAVQGGSAVLLQGNDAQSLDPAIVINSNSQGAVILNALYDVLFTFGDDGSFVPHIATSFTTTDGLTWTMKLRDGVKFTDGTAFDAAAVKAQWEYHKSNIRAGGYGAFTDVTSMTAVDATTFQIVLSKVNRLLDQAVPASSLTWIPSPTAYKGGAASFSDAPVGAGPFVIKSRVPNSETVLGRNASYWQAGLPKLDSLTVRTVTDPEQNINTVLSGGAQGSVSVNDANAAIAKDSGLTVVGLSSMVGGTGFLFGSKRAPFDDIRAREAVYLAIDRNAFNLTATNGAGDVPAGFVSENSPYYHSSNDFPASNSKRAQELLDQLAAEGKPVKFTITTAEGDAVARAVAIQTQLSKYKNITVDVKSIPGSSYGTTLYAGDFDMAIYGMLGSQPEPVVASWRTGLAIPIASMGSAEVDALVQQAREATDDAGRDAAYSKLFSTVNSLYKMVFVARGHSYVVETSKVTGIQVYGQGSALTTNFGLVS